jgi:hypothetical protein
MTRIESGVTVSKGLLFIIIIYLFIYLLQFMGMSR